MLTWFLSSFVGLFKAWPLSLLDCRQSGLNYLLPVPLLRTREQQSFSFQTCSIQIIPHFHKDPSKFPNSTKKKNATVRKKIKISAYHPRSLRLKGWAWKEHIKSEGRLFSFLSRCQGTTFLSLFHAAQLFAALLCALVGRPFCSPSSNLLDFLQFVKMSLLSRGMIKPDLSFCLQ